MDSRLILGAITGLFASLALAVPVTTFIPSANTAYATEYIQTEVSLSTESDFTWEGWVKIPAAAASLAENRVFGQTDWTSEGRLILEVRKHSTTGGVPKFALLYRVNGANQRLIAEPEIVIDTWTHVAVTRAGANLKIYVNGVKSAEASDFTNLIQGAPFLIAPAFAGSLSEVRVWRSARSENEITLGMRQRFSGAVEGLVGAWALNDIPLTGVTGYGLSSGSSVVAAEDASLDIGVYRTSATSGKFSQIVWQPATPTGGPGVELVLLGSNFNLENDIEDLAFSKLDMSTKGTVTGKRLKAVSPGIGRDAVLRFGAQGAAVSAPLLLADNLMVTNNLNPTISGYTKINGVDGDISGPGKLTFCCAHRLNSSGYISLFGHNTFSGGLDILIGNVVPTNVVALGTGKVYCTNSVASAANATDYARLWLKNFSGREYVQCLTNSVYIGAQLAKVGNTARFQTDGNFTLTGDAALYAVAYRSKINGYGKWTLRKGIVAESSTSVAWEVGGYDNVLEKTPLNMPGTELLLGRQKDTSKGVVRIKVAGNRVGSLSAYLNSVLACDVDNAFANAPKLEPMNGQAGMVIELNGTEQTFGPHVDGSSHAPLLIRNTNTSRMAKVVLRQDVANRSSSLMTSGSLAFVKEGASTLTTTGGFKVAGDLVVKEGVLQLYGSETGNLAETVVVEGGELDLGGTRHTCSRLVLKGGRISNGTLVCTERAEIESGVSTAAIIGTVVKKGTGTVDFYTAHRTEDDAESSGVSLTVEDGVVKTSTLTAKGAVLYYPLSSEEDLMKDFSGNGKNLTSGGTGRVTFSTDSPFGRGGSASFDGASYLRHNSFPADFPVGSASYTVCMFVKVASGSKNNGCFVGYGENVSYHANHFRLNGFTKVNNYWAGEGFNLEMKDQGSFNDGHWHSIVGTYDALTHKRINYIDGGQTTGENTPAKLPAIVAKNFTIGCDSYRQTEWFTGQIAEVAVFPRALSQNEVAQYHAAGLGGGGLRVVERYVTGGTVDGNLILGDGVEVVGGAPQVVTGNVFVEGCGVYVPPTASDFYWDFITFSGTLDDVSIENLKQWTVYGHSRGYVVGRKNVLRANATVPGFSISIR